MNIIIIGSGWYGCHIASVLGDKYNITIIEKNNDIFQNSSHFNQNRLHLGYHYCRNYPTRQLCKKYYDTFINQYSDLIDIINNNYYVISNNSIIDYNTFLSIYNYEKYDFEIVNNCVFDNIDGDIIKVTEQVINSDKAYTHFKKKLKNVNFTFNETFISYKRIDNVINVITNKDNYKCDMLLDCTYNQCNLSKNNYIYEKTCSLLYKKIQNTQFDALTIMDGKFSSLYPRDIDNGIYTLTDVEFTPVISSNNVSDILNCVINKETIENVKNKMVLKFKRYYPDFESNFEYIDYFLSNKTKLLSNTDSRDITIEELEHNVITVNCGKIYGIFEWEKFILKYLEETSNLSIDTHL